MSDCNCPQGTFPYRIEWPYLVDGQEEPLSDGDVENNIADLFGISSSVVKSAPLLFSGDSRFPENTQALGTPRQFHNSTELAENRQAARRYEPGNVLCLPLDAMPLGYRSPCVDSLNDLRFNFALIPETQRVLANAKILGIAATATPDTVRTPHVYQLQQAGFNAEMARQILVLAEVTGTSDENLQEIQELLGYTPADFPLLDNMLSSNNTYLYNISESTGLGLFNLSMQAPYETGLEYLLEGMFSGQWLSQLDEELNPIDGVELANLLQQILDDAASTEFSESNQQFINAVINDSQDYLDTFQEAQAADCAEYPEMLADARIQLAAWDKDGEQEKLRELGSLTEQMHSVVPGSGFWMGDIVQSFVNFHVAMGNRWTQLENMQGSLDQIDWLMLTPEERIFSERLKTFLEQLEGMGIVVNIAECENPTTLEALRSCAANAIQQTMDPYGQFYDEQDVSRTTTIIWNEFGHLFQANYPDEYDRNNPWRYVEDTDETHNERVVTQLIDMLWDYGDSSSIVEDPYITEVNQAQAEQNAELLFFIAGFIPGVGVFLDLFEALRSLSEGDIGGALFNTFFAGIEIDELRDIGRSMRNLFGYADDIWAQTDDFAMYSPNANARVRRAREVAEQEYDEIVARTEGQYVIISSNFSGREPSEILRIDLGSSFSDDEREIALALVNEAIEQITSVHGIDFVSEIPIYFRMMNLSGAVHNVSWLEDLTSLSDLDTYINLHIANSTSGTLYHEFGHFIDVQGIISPERESEYVEFLQDLWRRNSERVRGTPANASYHAWNNIDDVPELANWVNAVQNSGTYQALQSETNRWGFRLSTFLGITDESFRLMLTRYSDPRELWARSYEQYILTTTEQGLDEMLSHARDAFTKLRPNVNLTDTDIERLANLIVWDPEDFRPISEAIDELFTQRGWRNE